MKSYKKTIAALVMMWICIGVASAVIVDYVSNTVTATIEVNSPLSSEISGDGTVWSSSIGLSVFGGETETIYINTTNNANASISGTVNTTITNTLGMTCEDFDSITVTVDGTPEGSPVCSVVNANTVSIKPGALSWIMWQRRQIVMNLAFKANALGAYAISSVVRP